MQTSGSSTKAQYARPLIFGEVLYDVFPDGTRVLGGAPFNVAWHLCGLRANPLFVSCIGADDDGASIRTAMQRWRLNQAGLQTDTQRPTGIVEVLDQDGGPGFQIPPEQAWDRIRAEDLPRAECSECGILYHGTLAARSEISGSALAELISITKIPVFLDVNLRAPWWQSQQAWNAMERADWVKLNDDELEQLTGKSCAEHDDCVGSAKELARKSNTRHVVVTRGEKGALIVDEFETVLSAAAPQVDAVVDTVGAGDAFSAVCIAGILRKWDVDQILKWAVELAGRVCGVRGALVEECGFYRL